MYVKHTINTETTMNMQCGRAYAKNKGYESHRWNLLRDDSAFLYVRI